MSDIFSKVEIIDYLEFTKHIIYESKKYNGNITAIAPNLNKDATESLVCKLIETGELLPQLNPIKSVERFSDKDVLVNKHHKLEVKATGSGDGTITPSESNYEAFAWLWMDFRPYFYENKDIIPIHTITNPKCCITTSRYVKTLKQNKLSIKSVIKDAIVSGNYYLNNFSLSEMRLNRMEQIKCSYDLSNKFFV